MLPQFRIAAKIAAKIGETVWDCDCGKKECKESFVKEYFVAIFVLGLEGKVLEGPEEFGPFPNKEKAQGFLKHMEETIRSGETPIKAVAPEHLH